MCLLKIINNLLFKEKNSLRKKTKLSNLKLNKGEDQCKYWSELMYAKDKKVICSLDLLLSCCFPFK